MSLAEYDRKVQDMQKYIPFLENLIKKLKNNNEEKPREAQLSKMQMLHTLLTNKDKKLKIETLLKCETVLIKLYNKVEKSKITTSSGEKFKLEPKPIDPTEIIEIDDSAPASPPSSDIGTEQNHAPIEIPTERRESPHGFQKSHNQKLYNRDRSRFDSFMNNNISKQELFKRRSPPAIHGNRIGRDSPSFHNFKHSDRSDSARISRDSPSFSNFGRSEGNRNRSLDNLFEKKRPSPSSFPNSHKNNFDNDRGRDRDFQKTNDRDRDFHKSNDRDREFSKSHDREFLNSHDREKSSDRDRDFSRSSDRDLPKTNDHQWEKERDPDKHRNPFNPFTSKSKPIFNRLGDRFDVTKPGAYENFSLKVKNDKAKASIPLTAEVLKSPPLSARDITDLINDSGGEMEEKCNNDLETVRKKLFNKMSGGKNKESADNSRDSWPGNRRDPRQDAKPKECRENFRNRPDSRHDSKMDFRPDVDINSREDHEPRSDSRREHDIDFRPTFRPDHRATFCHDKRSNFNHDSRLSSNQDSLRPDFRQESRFDKQDFRGEFRQDADFRKNTNVDFRKNSDTGFRKNADTDFRKNINVDFRQKADADPRQNSVSNFRQTAGLDFRPNANKSESRNDPQQDPLPADNSSVNFQQPQNIRLAYKYNPHPRKSVGLESPPFKPDEPKEQLKPNDPREPRDPRDPRLKMNIHAANKLPAVNTSDPRLRNRPMGTPFGLDSPCSPPAQPGSGKMPILLDFCATNASPMSPDSLFPNVMPIQTSNINTNYVNANQFSGFPKPHPTTVNSNPFKTDSDQMAYKKFHPSINDQVERQKYLESKKHKNVPKTYGEYRQAKLAEKQPEVPPKEKSKTSTFDNMYRSGNWNRDVQSVSDFKIPKVNKNDPRTVVTAENEEKKVKKAVEEEECWDADEDLVQVKHKHEEKREQEKLPKDHETDRSDKKLDKKIKSDSGEKSTEVHTKSKTKRQTRNEVPIKDSSDIETETELKKKPEKTSVLSAENNSAEKNDEKPEQLKDTQDLVEVASVDIAEKPKKTRRRRRRRWASVENDVLKDEIVDITEDKEDVEKSIEDVEMKTAEVKEVEQDKNDDENPTTFKRRTRSSLKMETPTEVVSTTDKEKESEVVDVKPVEKKPVIRRRRSRKQATTDGDESENCVVTSTTTTADGVEAKPETSASCSKTEEKVEAAPERPGSSLAKEEKKEEITKEWLEGFLLNIFNPALMNKSGVLNMLGKVLDEKKYNQIKDILDDDDEKPKAEVLEASKTEASSSVETKPQIVDTKLEAKVEEKESELVKIDQQPKPKQRKRGKNELDRLNEDIRDMFISQGVLTATGRRMCTIMNDKKNEETKMKEVTAQKQKAFAKQQKQAADDIEAKKKSKSTEELSEEMLPESPKKTNKKTAIAQKKAEILARKRGCKDHRGRPRIYPPGHTPTEVKLRLQRSCLRSRGRRKNQIEGIGEEDDVSMETHENHVPDKMPELIPEGDAEETAKPDDIVEKVEAKAKPVSRKRRRRKKVEIPEEPKVVEEEEEPPKKKKYKPCPKSKKKNMSNYDAVANIYVDSEDDEEATAPKKINGREEFIPMDFGSIDGDAADDDPIADDENVNIACLTNKNINADMHFSSIYNTKCVLCDYKGCHISHHYIQHHPESEVLMSRISASAFDAIKENRINTIATPVPARRGNLYQYECPICNTKNKCKRLGWMNHLGTHTGEYMFKCSVCHRPFNMKRKLHEHIKSRCEDGHVVELRKLNITIEKLDGYVCNLCNYIQLKKDNVERHLATQHEVTENFPISAITLCNFGKDRRRMKKIDRLAEAEELAAKQASVVEQVNAPKEQQNAPKEHVNSEQEKSPNKSAAPVEKKNSEAPEGSLDVFLSQTNEESQVDKNFIRFMSEVSFASDINPHPRPQRQKSMAEKLSERFKTNVSEEQNELIDVQPAKKKQKITCEGSASTENGEEEEANQTLSESSIGNKNSERNYEDNTEDSIVDRIRNRFRTHPETTEEKTDSEPKLIVLEDELGISTDSVDASDISSRLKSLEAMKGSNVDQAKTSDHESASSANSEKSPEAERSSIEMTRSSEDSARKQSISDILMRRFQSPVKTSEVPKTSTSSQLCSKKTQSVIDRLNERLKNLDRVKVVNVTCTDKRVSEAEKSTQSTISRLHDKLQNISRDEALVKPIGQSNSSTDGASKANDPLTTQAEDSLGADKAEKITSKNVPESGEPSMSVEKSANKTSCNDTEIVSPAIEGSKNNSDITENNQLSCSQSSETTDRTADEADENDGNDGEDDDEAWEDIETLPMAPNSSREASTSSATEKTKKNNIYETLSRLYASLMQPRSKSGSSGKKEKKKRDDRKFHRSRMFSTDQSQSSRMSEDESMATESDCRSQISEVSNDAHVARSKTNDTSEVTEKDVTQRQEVSVADDLMTVENIAPNLPEGVASTSKGVISSNPDEVLANQSQPLTNQNVFESVTTADQTMLSTNNNESPSQQMNDPLGFTFETETSQTQDDFNDLEGLMDSNLFPFLMGDSESTLTLDPLGHVGLEDAIEALVHNNVQVQLMADPLSDLPIDGTQSAGNGSSTSNEVLDSNLDNTINLNNGSTKNVEPNGENDTNMSVDTDSIEPPDPNPVIYRIDKLGYSKTQANSIKYHCLVEACSFMYSDHSFGLRAHFTSEHPTVTWDGYCYTCEANVCSDEGLSLERELKHMLEVHLKIFRINTSSNSASDDAVAAKPAASKPMLKFRRLSGDKLSSIPNSSKFFLGDTTPTPIDDQGFEPPMTVIDKTTGDCMDNVTQAPKSELKITNVLCGNAAKASQDGQSPEVQVKQEIEEYEPTTERSNDSPFFRIDSVVSLPQPVEIQSQQPPQMVLIQQQQQQQQSITQPNNTTPFLKIQNVVSLPQITEVQQAIPIPITVPSQGPMISTSSPIFVTEAPLVVSAANVPAENQFLQIQNVVSLQPQNRIPLQAVAQQPPTAAVTATTTQFKIQNVVSLSSESQSTILKPWTNSMSRKSAAVREKLLRDICLFSLFKCMGDHCTFTTNKSEKMEAHLLSHKSETGTDRRESWLECAYCDFWTARHDILIEHVNSKHISDIYQCPYCFYRTCADFNVITHLKNHHPNFEKFVFVCFGQKRILRDEVKDIYAAREKNVRPLVCSVCPMQFYILKSFVTHLLEVHPELQTFKCQICFCGVTKLHAAQHFFNTHSIALYECIYCLYASDLMDQMKIHLANRHPSSLPYVCVRMPKNERLVTKFETIQMSTVLVSTVEPISPKLFHKCPYTESQLNFMNPELSKTSQNLADPFRIFNEGDTSVITQKSNDLSISQVQSVSQVVFNAADKGKETFTITEVVSVNDLKKLHSKSQSQPKPVSSNPIPPAIEPAPSVEAVVTPKIIQPEHHWDRVLNCARTLVADTGVTMDRLYVCGFETCNEKSPDSMMFNIHMLKHTPSTSTLYKSTTASTIVYKCYHCANVLKSIVSLKQHMKSHAQHRYFCYVCMFTGSTVTAVTKHLADVHSKTNTLTYPLIPGKNEKNRDMFVVCPRNRDSDVVRFSHRVCKLYERKMSLMKKVFAPDEANALPRQAIFFDAKSCSICKYSTKVRANMFRHLQLHKNDKDVASVNPVNPVPCLKTNEKHFDKMVNLACSSNQNKDGTPSQTGKENGDDDKEEEEMSIDELKVPGYISHLKRFVCGVPDCRYLTISDSMLKYHLTALHSTEKTYICPHCQVEVCKGRLCGEKIIQHSKLHDQKLFVCGLCSYCHYQKHFIERHIAEKHPKKAVKLITCQRDDEEVKQTIETIGTAAVSDGGATASVQKAQRSSRWECALCKRREDTKGSIVAHMETFHYTRHKYQCKYCSFQYSQIPSIKDHMSNVHPTKAIEPSMLYYEIPYNELTDSDITPLWRRDPNRVKNIRGILMEEDDEEDFMPPARDTEEDSMEMQQEDDTNTATIEEETTTDLDRYLAEAPPEQPPGYSKCHKCDYQAPTNDDLIKHIRLEHDDFASKYANYEIDENLRSLKFMCYHCSERYDTIPQVCSHWEEKHKEAMSSNKGITYPPQPFCFRVSKEYHCGLCVFESSFTLMKVHFLNSHNSRKLLIRDVNDSRKCGLCSFKFRDLKIELNEHFNVFHKNAPVAEEDEEPFDHITQELLNKLLKIGNFLNTIKCLLCSEIFKNVQFYNDHHRDVHSNKKKLFDTNELLYACPSCPNVYSNELSFTVKHIRSHATMYRCDLCSQITSNSRMLSTHAKIHTESEATFTIIHPEVCMSQYMQMRLIFANGLIFSKRELTNTNYGNFEKIKSIIKAFDTIEASKSQQIPLKLNIADDLNAIDEILLQQNKSLLQPLASVESKPRKRRSSSAVRQSNKKSQGKKRNAKNQNIDQYESDDDWMPSAKKFKLFNRKQRGNMSSMEFYSFYGQIPMELDLKQVMVREKVSDKFKRVPCLEYLETYRFKRSRVLVDKVNIFEMMEEFNKNSNAQNIKKSSDDSFDDEDCIPLGKQLKILDVGKPATDGGEAFETAVSASKDENGDIVLLQFESQ